MKSFPKVNDIVTIEATESVTIARSPISNAREIIDLLKGKPAVVLQAGISGRLVLCQHCETVFTIELDDIKEIYPNGKVYLSGPISYNPIEAFEVFNKANIKLNEMGYDVANPFLFNHELAHKMEDEVVLFTPKQIHKEYMRVCYDELLKHEINTVVLLEGWEASEGAEMEVFAAKKYNYKFLSYPSMEEVIFQ